MSVLSLYVHGQRYEIGVIGGATGYMGDLNMTDPFYFRQYGGGIFVKRNFNPTWGIKASANQLLISGSDMDFKNEFQQERGLIFRNQLSEMALMVDFNFWTDKRRNAAKLTPYLSAGIAAVKHEPYIYYDQNKIKLRPLQLEYDSEHNTQEHKTWSIAIPTSIGIKYKLNNTWALGVETSYKLAFTDYLDNVSQYYATSFPSGINMPNVMIGDTDNKRPFDVNDWYYLADPSLQITTKAGSARGDGRSKDGYMTAGITLTYTLRDRNCFPQINR